MNQKNDQVSNKLIYVTFLNILDKKKIFSLYILSPIRFMKKE